LLAIGTVHHHLMRAGLRSRVSLVVETDEARDVHHVVSLLSHGAQAICLRLAFQSIAALASAGHLKGDGIDPAGAQQRFRQAIEDGTLKVLAKMGISTVDSYQGAQIFEILGLDAEVVEGCFTGTPSAIAGATFEDLAEETLGRRCRRRSRRRARAPEPRILQASQAGHGVPRDEPRRGRRPA